MFDKNLLIDVSFTCSFTFNFNRFLFNIYHLYTRYACKSTFRYICI